MCPEQIKETQFCFFSFLRLCIRRNVQKLAMLGDFAVVSSILVANGNVIRSNENIFIAVVVVVKY